VAGRTDEPRGRGALELPVPPVTGSSSHTLSLCRRKDRVNACWRRTASRCPPGGWWSRDGPRTGLDFPAIVKPAGEDGSVGIHEWSVADDALELNAALGRQSSGSLVQRFVGGRELNVAFVGR
jgi:D-alanine-D-alanine ligase-like ATP-grasp enzyme